MVNLRFLVMLVCCSSFLSGCAITGRHVIAFDDIQQVGFTAREVIELGLMVNTAYTLFHADPKSVSPAAPTFQGYLPVANLLGRDDPSSTRTEFYGHISRSISDPQVMVISIRGTSDAAEWLDDIKFEHEPFSDDPRYGHIERGFSQIFDSLSVSPFSQIAPVPLADYLSSQADIKQFVFVGHSLGSSIATLAAMDRSVHQPAVGIKLLTFASPRTGDNTFTNAFYDRIKQSLRIVNQPDIVPRVPPRLFSFRHVWHEAKVNSKQSNVIKHSVACYHSLLTYLHVLTTEAGQSIIAPDDTCLTI